jgi:ABC-type multidrug transport system fused ATPase/permease subunit
LVTAALMVGFAITSGITIGMISPFVKILFTPRQQVAIGPPAPHAAQPPPSLPDIPGVGAIAGGDLGPTAVSDASTGAPGSSGIAKRFSEWKRDMRTWFEGFFLTGDPIRSLNRICLTLLIAFFLKNAFDYLQSVLTVWVEQAVVRDMRNEVYSHLHQLSLSFFHSRRAGALLSRLTNDIALIRGALAAGFSNLIKSGLLLAVCLFWIFWTSWRLALISLIVIPPSIFLIVWLGKKLRRRSTITQERMADLNSILRNPDRDSGREGVFDGEFEKRKFARVARDYFRSFVKQRRLGATASPSRNISASSRPLPCSGTGDTRILLQRRWSRSSSSSSSSRCSN